MRILVTGGAGFTQYQPLVDLTVIAQSGNKIYNDTFYL